MTPLLWALRACNLAAALFAAWLGARGRAGSILVPALAAAALAAAEGAAAFSGRPLDRVRRRWAALGFSIADSTLVLWLAFWAPQTAGVFDLAYLLPAALAAVEYGPVAGALAGAAPALLTAFVLMQGLAPEVRSFGALVAARAAFFILVPAAAGVALSSARADGSARARETLARLRAAQIGEYLSLALFQLRDYVITIGSLAEAIALSAPKDDAKLAERSGRLRRSVGELSTKMSRLLGDNTALTTGVPAGTAAVDILTLVRETAARARDAFGAPGVSVDVLPEGDVPAARTDRRAVELSLLSVLQNSLEACAARGGGAVTVLVRAGQGAVELEVADDGGGIPEAAKPLLFEPLSSARSGSHGMGLGLSMSRRFLERIGGGLRLKSKGGYTAVLIVVPLERALPVIRHEESTWAGRRAES